jgi:photosynthetic reaction center H subunit
MSNAMLFSDIDVAQVCIWLFWAFFLGLVLYLRREDRREGYPLESETTGRKEATPSFLFFASPKKFILPHGHGVVYAPNKERDTRPIAGKRASPFAGSPLIPTGNNPLSDCIGPSSYAERADVPDLMHDGSVKLVPLRAAPGFAIVRDDGNPVGYKVLGADRQLAGTVADLWVDKAEALLRYIEVKLADSERTVLVPMTMAVVDRSRKRVMVSAINAAQFAGAPGLKSPEQVSFLEEEKIVGYFGGGYLYANPQRAEPII